MYDGVEKYIKIQIYGVINKYFWGPGKGGGRLFNFDFLGRGFLLEGAFIRGGVYNFFNFLGGGGRLLEEIR